jgi:hypothetical protein
MERTTLEYILKAFNAVSTDQSRPALQYVYVKRGKVAGQVSIRATDARMLSDVTVTDSDLYESLGERQFLFGQDNEPILKLILKQSKSAPIVGSKIVDEKLEVTFGEFATLAGTKEHRNVTPPDLDRVVAAPICSEEATQIAFNVALLLDLAKAIKNGSKDPIVKLTLRGEKNPIKVDCDGQTGILMPCRI